MKRLLTILGLIIGIIGFTAFGAFEVFARDSERVTEEVLRLHIPANSDSERDQAVKLELRDYLLDKYGAKFSQYKSLDEAEKCAAALLTTIERDANEFLKQRGFDYGAKAELVQMWFTTREYDRLILPAGNYTALRVTLGAGEGHNWWCVIFPQLCLPAASRVEEPSQAAEGVLDSFGRPQRITVKFAVFEWLESLFNN